MKKLRMILFTSIFAALAILPVVGIFDPAAVSAVDAKNEICSGLGGSGGSDCQVAGQPNIEGTIQAIINIFSAVTGIAAVIMIIVAGFRFVTANGDSGTIAAARRTVMYAIVGLIVVAMAQLIVRFVVADIL